ncbi:small terminase [Vibrio phage YC]|uniref:Small terminase n=1 Tax=Vibrio phage YC TaxID=2267403 RepID=A0A384ZSD4_9CAUD|nr:small terminase [Vibrio phage YC]AXC34524.1 small terminase [Vibrio phage YC]
MSNQDPMTMELLNSLGVSSQGGVPPAGSSPSDDDFGEIVIPEFESDLEKESNTQEIQGSNIKEDADFVRNMTYAMMGVSTELLQNGIKMAAMTDNPRAYSVVNELMNTMRALGKDLTDISKTMVDVEKKAVEARRPQLPANGTSTSAEMQEDGTVRVTETKTTTTDLLALVERVRQNGGSAEGLDTEKEINPIEGDQE